MTVTPTPSLTVTYTQPFGRLNPNSTSFIEISAANNLANDLTNTVQLSSSVQATSLYQTVSATLYQNGGAQSSVSYQGYAFAGTYNVGFQPSIGLGLTSFTATQTILGDTPSSVSAPVNVFEIGTTGSSGTSGYSSLDVAALLSNGYQYNFTNGTAYTTLVDGIISYGQGTPEANLQRLYVGLLSRPSDPAGIANYDGQIAQGGSTSTVATQIVGSPEYVNVHGTQTDTQFLLSTFQGLLGRTPTASETATYQNELAAGTTRGAIASGIANYYESAQFLAPYTTDLFVRDNAGTLAHEAFKTELGREVDLASLAPIQSGFAQGMTAAQLFAGVAASSEFAAIHNAQDNTAFVTSIFQTGLGRAPDAGSLGVDVAALSSGSITRAGLSQIVATSPEAAAHLTSNAL